MDNVFSITKLCLQDCDIEPPGRDLAAALQRNTNIETLKTQQVGGHLHHSIVRGLEIQ